MTKVGKLLRLVKGLFLPVITKVAPKIAELLLPALMEMFEKQLEEMFQKMIEKIAQHNEQKLVNFYKNLKEDLKDEKTKG